MLQLLELLGDFIGYENIGTNFWFVTFKYKY